MIDFENLSGKALTDYLIEHPQAVTENILKTLDKEAWTRLLIKAPRWQKFSPWQKFNGGCWVRLLKQQPQFAKFCNWGKLNSANWSELPIMRSNPTLRTKCSPFCVIRAPILTLPPAMKWIRCWHWAFLPTV